MTERDLEKQLQSVLTHRLPGCNLWKICDQQTGGQPDLEVNWDGATTKLEFKFLGPHEDLHKKWEDGRQLQTCVKYERTTGRCWVVAFVRANKKRGDLVQPKTRIYRPTALMFGQLPELYPALPHWGSLAAILWNRGVIEVPGFNHDAIVELIKQTHRP